MNTDRRKKDGYKKCSTDRTGSDGRIFRATYGGTSWKREFLRDQQKGKEKKDYRQKA